jgi:hypothetical protein
MNLGESSKLSMLFLDTQNKPPMILGEPLRLCILHALANTLPITKLGDPLKDVRFLFFSTCRVPYNTSGNPSKFSIRLSFNQTSPRIIEGNPFVDFRSDLKQEKLPPINEGDPTKDSNPLL